MRNISADNWKVVTRDGRQVVKLRCPDCGEWGDLEDHNVAADGTLDASVICPNDCSFHEWVWLMGWGTT